jgi:hypothetical protein
MQQSKLFIDPSGKTHHVCFANENFTHEEWARKNKYDLDVILQEGWIRVQFLPPTYLFIDTVRKPLLQQHNAIRKLFFDSNNNLIVFNNILIEIAGESYCFFDTFKAYEMITSK